MFLNRSVTGVCSFGVYLCLAAFIFLGKISVNIHWIWSFQDLEYGSGEKGFVEPNESTAY